MKWEVEMSFNFWDYNPSDLDVSVSELLVASANGSDALIHESVMALLKSLRENLGQEVIFVSEFRNGMRMFQFVDTKPGAELIAAGGGSEVEASFCKYVLEGQLPRLVNDVATSPHVANLPATPFRVGAHISVPIVLADGRVYGTLCSFSREADPSLNERDLNKLDCVARVLAKRIGQNQG